MPRLATFFGLSLLTASLSAASPFIPRDTNSTANNLTVDLGYSVYEGYYESDYDLNIWKGIRYAAPPVGDSRWQAPKAPETNRSQTISAQSEPDKCPQGGDGLGTGASNPLLTVVTGTASEDCLFLNVWSPPGASNLPVMVWIHGGGYGGGSATQLADPRALMQTNHNGFVVVYIQYRLGAFGFLSSEDVHSNGVVNAGLLDQDFALQWVQDNIGLFGGNKDAVTVAGESAGAGSVMLHAMAYGGNRQPQLFNNLIASSPYLPFQQPYDGEVPTSWYNKFAASSGCPVSTSETFSCLVGKNTTVLQAADNALSGSGAFGTWAFLPVTDGKFVQNLPSEQLAKGAINGQRILTSNNAEEGWLFTPQTILTDIDFMNYIKSTFPSFTDDDISELQQHYPSLTLPPGEIPFHFATRGSSGPTTLNQSFMAIGVQQRSNAVYGETTFMCPSYWLADAFSTAGLEAYKYQYSVPPAIHGTDLLAAQQGSAALLTSTEFVQAFHSTWGNFVMNGNPSVSAEIAAGSYDNPLDTSGIVNFPQWSTENRTMVAYNMTGISGIEVHTVRSYNVTGIVSPDAHNYFRTVDADSWEGGRGARCDWWKSVGPRVPE
ncbi:MAG: hypothetical protein M1819_006195 [Sarea resinae]|nr:MAG: hypothetical protein M1819_006195 [Sarea resinae]